MEEGDPGKTTEAGHMLCWMGMNRSGHVPSPCITEMKPKMDSQEVLGNDLHKRLEGPAPLTPRPATLRIGGRGG